METWIVMLRGLDFIDEGLMQNLRKISDGVMIIRSMV